MDLTVKEVVRRAGSLPASAVADTLNDALRTRQAAVVVAPPGAGKSTLLPLTIMAADSGKVLMLEPRRLAARQIAERMASILGEEVGQTVGYRVRFEKKVSSATRIEVLTEGILSRMLVEDATLEGVGTVIFDEFHERSIHSDLALALTRFSISVVRPDLRIVIMSATIDATAICQALKAPLISCEGRMFPVHISYAAQDFDPKEADRVVAQAVLDTYRQQPGDILAFLPGQGEITRCADLLREALPDVAIYPLFGNLPPDMQRKAIAPSLPGERKVVLATPIAETSITIEGVRAVVDSGLCRSLVFDPRTSLSRLQTVHISLDMANQRSGRAGRVSDGYCCRLWTKSLEQRMEPQRKSEITYADLAPMLLDISAFGEANPEELPWLTLPPPANMARARKQLIDLGAIDDKGGITSIGRKMAKPPCHPRIARMILQAGTPALKALACDIAALLEEKDPMALGDDPDITLRIATLRKSRGARRLDRWQKIAQLASEYRRMAHVDEYNEMPSAHEIGYLTACAYPERVAKAIDHIGTYRLASGDTVSLSQNSALTAYDWLAVASLHAATNIQGHVFLAAPVSVDDLHDIASEQQVVSWDSKQGRLLMQTELRIGRITLDAKPLKIENNDLPIQKICEAVGKEGLSLLDWDDGVTALQQRVAQVAQWHPELELPDLSTQHLLDTAAEWLPPFLVDGSGHLRCTASELNKIDLRMALWSLLTYEMQQQVDRLAPSHIVVPTGSRIRIDYRIGASAPVLSVRLQECFGMVDTPRVDGGRQPLLMELLSPGFKPVQLTNDLCSFWQNAYFEVRKELKRRYPKHSWPDNPLEAPAVRGVRKRQ